MRENSYENTINMCKWSIYKYSNEQNAKMGQRKNIELEVRAVPMSEYLNVYKNFDCILIGPQISYQYNEIKANAIDVPVEKFPQWIMG